MQEFIEENYGNLRGDAEILEKKDINVLRQHRMMRFATEAYDQGGLLVQEDLSLLLNSGPTISHKALRTLNNKIIGKKKKEFGEVIFPHRI